MDLLHKPVRITFTDNAPGSSTYELLFTAITQQYPELGLTHDEHVISHIQHFTGRYTADRTVAIVTHRTNPTEQYRFVYDRFRIDRYFSFPLFGEDELALVQTLDEPALVQVLVEKTGLNLDPRDFLIATAGITYTGGLARPNWRLEARPDSPYWYGQVIIPLHDGTIPEPPPEPEPEPEPEPVEGHYELLFPPKLLSLDVSAPQYVATTEDLGYLLAIDTSGTVNRIDYYNPLAVVLPTLEELVEQDVPVGSRLRLFNEAMVPVAIYGGPFGYNQVLLPSGGWVECVYMGSSWIYPMDGGGEPMSIALNHSMQSELMEVALWHYYGNVHSTETLEAPAE